MVAIESAYPNSTDWCSKDIEKSAIPIECLADGVFGPRLLQVFLSRVRCQVLKVKDVDVGVSHNPCPAVCAQRNKPLTSFARNAAWVFLQRGG